MTGKRIESKKNTWQIHDKPNVMEWEDLTKITGAPLRHIEQLWDEVQKLKERVKILEKLNDR